MYCTGILSSSTFSHTRKVTEIERKRKKEKRNCEESTFEK